jgi:hypothetical protein
MALHCRGGDSTSSLIGIDVASWMVMGDNMHLCAWGLVEWVLYLEVSQVSQWGHINPKSSLRFRISPKTAFNPKLETAQYSTRIYYKQHALPYNTVRGLTIHITRNYTCVRYIRGTATVRYYTVTIQ